MMVDGLVIDSFAGGGGASTGIMMAIGRAPDVAINHDPEAVAMHAANHPETVHYCKNVWHADPVDVVRAAGGGPVALAWFSPDCKHFSKAKGARPVKRNIRDLAWVVVLWARRVRPRVIMLENVEEFQGWGPVFLDGIPCRERAGQTFKRWVAELRRLGYRVEWRELRACDFGAPTIRKRLFMIARCDGAPIVWPDPTHGPGRLPYRTAADCIDWSIPCPSIFDRPRPLTENTMKRIARGLRKFVIEAEEPFFVSYAQQGGGNRSAFGPHHTVTASRKDQNCIVVPHLSRQFGRSVGHNLDEPIGTVTTKGKTALVAAYLAKHFGGMTGVGVGTPLPTTTTRGTQTQLVTSHLVKLRGTCRHGQAVSEPMPTVTSGGTHIGEVRAFIVKYYGSGGQDAPCNEPMHTLTAKPRMGLVTVAGEPFEIVDIGMRMLTPRELFRAQGFPESYVIDPVVNGRPLSQTAQIRMCGNSVCPDVAAALVRANVGAVAAIGGEAAA